MRLLIWIFKGLWGGSVASFIGAIVLLIAGLTASYFMVLPYFNPAISMSTDDLADLGIPPSNLQRVIIEGKLLNEEVRANLNDELGYYTVLELKDDYLLLVGSLEAFPEGESRFTGRLENREPRHTEIFDDIADDENLDGEAIPALFVLGEIPQSEVTASMIAAGLLLGFGLMGIIRFGWLKMHGTQMLKV